MSAMPAGPLLALLAQAAVATDASHSVYGPVPPAAKPVAAVKEAPRECSAPVNKDPNAREIVVCAVRPQGYRLDPDVLEARREKKQGIAGRPHNPHESFADHSCATVGPMGCRFQGTINLLAAATTLATMADRLSKGQEIGSLFITDPHPSEYQLYQEAKKRREAEEAQKAAKAKAAAQPAQNSPATAPAHP